MKDESNPFYSQHVFTKEDFKRCRLTKADRIRVLLRPMYVQFAEGHVMHYKTTADGRIFIFKLEPAPPEEG